MIRRFKILPNHLGLFFQDGKFSRLLNEGNHRFFDPMRRVTVEIVSTDDVVFMHPQFRRLTEGDHLDGVAQVLELTDYQRGLLWVDDRFHGILSPDSYILWTTSHRVKFEVVDAREIRFEHADLAVITRHPSAQTYLNICDVDREHKGVFHLNGRYVETVEPGRYAFWKNIANTRVVEIDMRERMLDISGQDLMTSDNLSLRLNTVVAYRVTDVQRAISSSQSIEQSLYRESQLALRDMVSTRTLEDLLANKGEIGEQTESELEKRVAQFGIELSSFGIRDVILPGEMKALLNKVTEARMAAEANLISRREETAAMRSQANTAKLLEANPTLMRLRELEVLEKVAGSSNLKVVLGGDQNLGERLTRLV